MAIPLYLAMTAAEFASCEKLPVHYGWMACHFSPYGLGLSNIPSGISEAALIIINDRTPIHGHDPQRILNQLRHIPCSRLLLDFQRPDIAQTRKLAELLVNELPCPVGVSEQYADELDCPVFLPPVPPYVTAEAYLKPFQGREIWLEAAFSETGITLTKDGSRFTSLPACQSGEFPHRDSRLHCSYRLALSHQSAVFTLRRSADDLTALLAEAEAFGVTASVGLYQELAFGKGVS